MKFRRYYPRVLYHTHFAGTYPSEAFWTHHIFVPNWTVTHTLWSFHGSLHSWLTWAGASLYSCYSPGNARTGAEINQAPSFKTVSQSISLSSLVVGVWPLTLGCEILVGHVHTPGILSLSWYTKNIWVISIWESLEQIQTAKNILQTHFMCLGVLDLHPFGQFLLLFWHIYAELIKYERWIQQICRLYQQ